MTNQKIDKYSALINQGFLENKLKMIPTSIKETYSEVSKEPVLLTRELIADDRVVLGVEYNTNGEAVNAYTSDKSGRHITIARVEDITQDNLSVRDMIAEHLKKMSGMQKSEQPEQPKEKPAPAKKKVVARKAPSLRKTNTRA